MPPETRSDQQHAAGPAAPSGSANRLSLWLEAAAFFVLLLVVAMRPLVTETYDSARDPISRALDVPVSLTPAATAWFDLAIWLAAAAAAVAAGRRRLAWRWTGLEIGGLLMLAGAVFSTVVTSNKRLAINCSADWLTAAVLAAALANLCRDRRRVALVLAVVVASGLTAAARCVMQKRFEYADTWQQYQQMKADFWPKQGVPLDDPRVDLFERRLRAREASGFFALSNAQGAGLALAGFAALAAMTLRNRGPGQRVVLALLAALLLACIHTTGSRGAMLAALLSLGLLAAAWHFRETLRRRWRPLLAAAWLAIAVAAIGLVAYGRSHGGLPGSSLNFRWQYWQVTRAIIAEHFLVGVGAGNFDRVYLASKPIAFPEEIKDPHNFLLSVFAQWGVLGAAGLVLALVGASVVAARRWGRGDEPDSQESSQTCMQPTPTEDLTHRRSSAFIGGYTSSLDAHEGRLAASFRFVLAVAVGFMLLRLWIHRDLLGGDQAYQAMLVLDLGLYGLLWCVAFVGLSWLDRSSGPDGPGYRLPLLAGVAAFLLANTIDFSLLQPGTLTPFAALAGLLLAGAARPGRQPASPAQVLTPAIVVLLGLGFFAYLMFWPVARASQWLCRARASDYPTAAAAYQAAAEADPLDPTPLTELAVLCARSNRIEGLNRAVDAVNEAIQRDPDRLLLYQYRAGALEARYRLAGSVSDLLGAVGAARRCVEIYPASPDQHLELAGLLARAGDDFGSPQLLFEAIQHYRRAIELNDARPGTDEARRWSPQRVKKIIQRLAALETPATATATATAPSSHRNGL